MSTDAPMAAVAAAGAPCTSTGGEVEDFYTKRHLDSFKNSMEEWRTYDPNAKNFIKEETMRAFVLDLVASEFNSKKSFERAAKECRKKHKCGPSKAQIIAAYNALVSEGLIIPNATMEQLFIKKSVRTTSGVVVITVLTAPGPFSCPEDCHYCPNEPGQPRSYLSTEPAVLRGNQNGWDAMSQFNDRAGTLERNGHTIDKIEILVLGGTWSGYPADYKEEFIRDLFYAANTFHDTEPKREKKTLEEEQSINESTECKIIGLTLETRPDYITKTELRALRRFGCTRVQIGVQHTDNAILKYINRGHTVEQASNAIRLLKDACFKVDIHIMPDLPGSNPDIDRQMFDKILNTPDLQADQWKIYPCEVTPFTQIEKWFKEGKYIPYAERDDGKELLELLMEVKSKVHPWIRLNRVIRDIPNQSIIAGNDRTNLRQILEQEMKKRGLKCPCIRCREVREKTMDPSVAVLKEREYPTTGGREIFLSFETPDEQTIFGFLRLRLRDKSVVEAEAQKPSSAAFKELINCAFVRELHVYGLLVGVQEGKNSEAGDARPQHSGFGKRLILRAEEIALKEGFKRMAIIAGIGTRDYYRKFGYELEGTYMTKSLTHTTLQLTKNEIEKSASRQNVLPTISEGAEGVVGEERERKDNRWWWGVGAVVAAGVCASLWLAYRKGGMSGGK
eukprot:GDKI01025875.1.p1 GENE.GDKI01025875.1~~GDKI01025875.1.p1  ORF type:complete len:676 (-),score=224.58 GDKI01025875.1:26-2053(-)